jgi:hypothetical protein
VRVRAEMPKKDQREWNGVSGILIFQSALPSSTIGEQRIHFDFEALENVLMISGYSPKSGKTLFTFEIKTPELWMLQKAVDKALLLGIKAKKKLEGQG